MLLSVIMPYIPLPCSHLLELSAAFCVTANDFVDVLSASLHLYAVCSIWNDILGQVVLTLCQYNLVLVQWL